MFMKSPKPGLDLSQLDEVPGSGLGLGFEELEGIEDPLAPAEVNPHALLAEDLQASLEDWEERLGTYLESDWQTINQDRAARQIELHESLLKAWVRWGRWTDKQVVLVEKLVKNYEARLRAE